MVWPITGARCYVWERGKSIEAVELAVLTGTHQGCLLASPSHHQLPPLHAPEPLRNGSRIEAYIGEGMRPRFRLFKESNLRDVQRFRQFFCCERTSPPFDLFCQG